MHPPTTIKRVAGIAGPRAIPTTVRSNISSPHVQRMHFDVGGINEVRTLLEPGRHNGDPERAKAPLEKGSAMLTIERALLSEISHFHIGLRRHFDGPMNAEGTTLAQARLLMTIKSANGDARAADLSELHGYSPPTIAKAIVALEERDFIVRRPDPVDRRVKRLAITATGEAVIEQVEPLHRALALDIVEALTPSERDLFRDLLGKMYQRLVGASN